MFVQRVAAFFMSAQCQLTVPLPSAHPHRHYPARIKLRLCLNHPRIFITKLHAFSYRQLSIAGVAQWQSRDLPGRMHRFDSCRLLQSNFSLQHSVGFSRPQSRQIAPWCAAAPESLII